jgi:EmrB/QacA subfamily drug resistance transporter
MVNQIIPNTGLKTRYWVLIAIGVGTFMSALDGSVVNTILPVIKQGFGSSISTVEWAVVVYLLVVSGLLLTFGRLGDIKGNKPVYLSGFILFISGSALCGLSPNAWFLVLFRGLQAVGASMLLSNSPAILTKSFSPAQRGRALGMQGTMTYLGLMVGPALGGFLTQQLGWRAVFFINVPVGLLAFILSIIFVPSEFDKTKVEKFDGAGAVVFMAGLIALLLGLNQGSTWGWSSPAILGLFVIAFLLLGLFINIELHKPNPMLDLSLFRNRIFVAGAGSAVLNYVALYGVIFLMPFYLIQGRGLNPEKAGLLLTAQAFIMAISAPISGTLSDKIGSRVLSTLGMLILSAGLFMLTLLDGQTSQTSIILALGICGLGTGIFVSPNNSAMLGSAPRNRQGIASGVLATARNVGMVLGVGMAGAFLTSGIQQSTNLLYPAIHAGFLAASIAALLGCFASAVRGNGKSARPLKDQHP